MDEEYAIRHLDNITQDHGLTYNVTSIAPLGLAAIIILGVLMLLLKRKHAVLPMIIAACFIPIGQRFVIFSLDFTFLRMMILFGMIRVLLRREIFGFEWKLIDKIFIVWAISGTVAYTLLYGNLQALVFKVGGMYDALGMYFLFRLLVKDWDDVRRNIVYFALISFPVALLFVIEHKTGRNIFAFMGGVPEFTLIRGDRMRCQGAFNHPIAAGCFWASLLPLIGALWWSGRNKVLVFFGFVNSFLIFLCSGSSTPAGAVVAGIVAAMLFPARYLMRYVQLGLVFVLILLHIVMKAPVWALIARVDVVGGSTSYHRYLLVDQAIRRFDEWWLVGTKSTAHWGWFLFDVANQYVSEAVRGGFLTLLLFLLILYLSYRGIGLVLLMHRKDRSKTILAWALGVSLFMHCIAFFGLHYLGQILVIWYLLLASIACLTPAKVTYVRKGKTVVQGEAA